MTTTFDISLLVLRICVCTYCCLSVPARRKVDQILLAAWWWLHLQTCTDPACLVMPWLKACFCHLLVRQNKRLMSNTNSGLRYPLEEASKTAFSGLVQHWVHYRLFCLIAHQIVMAKHGGSCVHFPGISTCGRTSRETVSHPQCPPLPTQAVQNIFTHLRYCDK